MFNERRIPSLTQRLCGIALGVVLAMASTAGVARAWPAGNTASETLVGFNWDYFQFAYFPYTASSDIAYTKVWAGYGYTRIDLLAHETQTDTNWSSYSSNLNGSITTTFYSDSYYLATFTTNLNGSCVGPPWTFWICDSGSLNITVLGTGYGYFTGTMGIGGGGWGTYGGSSAGSSYQWVCTEAPSKPDANRTLGGTE